MSENLPKSCQCSPEICPHQKGRIMSMWFCRVDGLVIRIGAGSFADQMAQEAGFCGEACEAAFMAQKELDEKRGNR